MTTLGSTRALVWGKFRRWPRLRLFVIAAAILAVAIALRWARHDAQSPPQGFLSTRGASARTGPCEVLAVIDGDTLLVRQVGENGGDEFVGKVRLLGINTPETVQRGVAPQSWGKEATEFLRAQIAQGNVRLELDKRRLDQYGRSLAYVYVGQRHVNEALVAAGLARVHIYPGDSMTMNRQLLKAQDEAKVRQLGIWKTANP